MKKISFLLAALLLAAQSIKAQEIFDAVKNNDLTKAEQILIKDPSQANLKDMSGNAPLHNAVIAGSVELAELLLSNGADINAVNTQLNTPLHAAIISGKTETAKLLIEKGAGLNIKNISEQVPLHLAATFNRKEIGELIILKGAEIDIRDAYQRTPFMYVARQNGNVEFGKIFIKHGADVNVSDKYGDKPLNLSAWRGFKDFIDLLLDNGADFDTSRGSTLQTLRFAAGCGSVRLFNKVSETGKDLFAKESVNKGTMRNAIAGGSTEIVNLLLAKNIPVSHDANIYGWTPLHYAAANGHLAMVELLVEKGADINKRTPSGKSPYNLADESGNKDMTQKIIKLGGNTDPQQFPELKGAYLGQTPPDSGSKLFAPDIVSMTDEEAIHSSPAISPDGKEIYWYFKNKIWMSKLENDKWTIPAVASMSRDNDGKYSDDVPFISPDGKRMFFTSSRPVDASGLKKENIWYVDKTPTGWSEPEIVSTEVNAMSLHWSLSVSNSGNLFFGGKGEGGFGGGDIYYSRLIDGKYSSPVNIGPVINGKDLDHCPYIAPDESYLLFARMSFTEGQGFFISYKDKNGQWMNPVRLDESFEGVCPAVSPDGKYLFFLGYNILWTSAKFIEELRPE
jgi:ankyrin repeat protein